MSGDGPSPAESIGRVDTALREVFVELDALCGSQPETLLHRPGYPGAWSSAEHLEHLVLVNHFLLLTITKGVGIALRRAATRPVPEGESDLSRLDPVGDPDAFPWDPPGHMLPVGRPLGEVRSTLRDQRNACSDLLGRMGAGQGRLCTFRMSVNNLGRLDMYQWLYFLARHGRWHLNFLQRRGECFR